ncbi:branched-chain amino acid ABC transporter permease [Gordonia sp. SID5947]|uniref:AzlC family ABC transporter permease n=1 Tax=Gordonia sp. SID5947 TaxID=2690315 RepID=UPI001371C1B5|nr:AzlC family ABC transporter permease [Gordonia sp. SID5947]MYR06452.1 branched-chain amino acid ABC transporter permease [Gordonia sp. SID5947]
MRSSWRTLDPSAVRAIVVMSASVLVIGTSYGVAAHTAGLAWWQILTIATVVLAGSSEFVFVGVIAGGGAPLVAALAGLLVNSRNFGYGLSVGKHLGRGLPLALGAHLINDETAALAAGERDSRRARAMFFLCGVGILIGWPLGSVLGSAIGGLVASPESLGLDAAFPALLAALAVPALRERTTLAAALIGGGVAVVASPFLPAGVPIMLSLLGVALVEVMRRRPTIAGTKASGDPAEGRNPEESLR